MILVALALTVAALAEPAAPRTAAELNALITFRSEVLQLREIQTLVPGRVTVMHSHWGWGGRPWRGYGWHSGDVVAVDPATFTHEWAVYQGAQRLTVPDYLRAVGRGSEATALSARIQRSGRAGKTWSTVGVAGLAGGLVSLIGGVVTSDAQTSRSFTSAGLGGIGIGITGSLIGSLTRSKATTLAHDYERSLDVAEVQRAVRERNEVLREELGLTPAQAYHELSRTGRK